MTISVTYEFARSNDVYGFARKNRSSTDAKGLVETWVADTSDRMVEVLYDDDSQTGNMNDKLVARLTTTQADMEANPDIIDKLCMEFGLSRTVVSGSPCSS